MQSDNAPLSDEAVHDAAIRLRDAFRLKSAVTTEQERADFDVILAWIMRQTELPATYKRPAEATAAEHQ